MERLVFMNGRFVPERDAKISIWDTGFQLGYTVFETERTFRHEIFKLNEHIDRLWRSATYAQIDPGLTKVHLIEATKELLQRNLELIGPDDDYWVYQHVTGGVFNFFHSSELQECRQTVIINCFPIAFSHYAELYLTGAHAVVPSMRIPPPICQDPKMKCRSRIYYHLADLQAKQSDPDAYCLLLDLDGKIAENRGANFFIASDGILRTPTTRNALAGISRQTVIELACKLNIRVVEEDLQLFDAYTADEAFFTSTSFCILPISKIDHVSIGSDIPGPVTRRLLSAWSEAVRVDIVGQALRHGKTTGDKGVSRPA